MRGSSARDCACFAAISRVRDRNSIEQAPECGGLEIEKRALFGNDASTLSEGEIRWMIHNGEAGQAVLRLKPLLDRAEAAGRRRRALRLRVLLAVALEREGNERAALRVLREAVKLATAERFARVFVDEGDSVVSLLQKLTRVHPETDAEAAAFLQRLTGVEAVDTEPGASQRAASAQDALTRKEAEVLQVLAEGLPNVAIAARLFISEATVRTHLRSINGKLRVHNRTEAIAVARRRGLIS